MTKTREAKKTVQCVDTYSELYKDIFPEVRSYESFKYIIVGILSDIKRKSLPAIASSLGLKNEQGLLHFMTDSPWELKELEKRRLNIILEVLEGREIIVIIDETGDLKKGKTTDYVKRQYIGNLGKIESGIVSVNAYGYCNGVTFPLESKVFKPKERLKEGDKYKTKPELAVEIIKELEESGFKIKRVVSDSLYGESHSNFISAVEELKIEYAVGIRSNHGVWLPKEAKIRANKWRRFEHIRWDGKQEDRHIREIVYGKKNAIRYWEIKTETEKEEEKAGWFVMTRIPDIKYKEVGRIYGVRSWIEYGFKQCKSELGWADFRVTHYEQIQKWWELVMCAYCMICFYDENFNSTLNSTSKYHQKHEKWDKEEGWKKWLNNLRLVISVFNAINLIKKWLKVFPFAHVLDELTKLYNKVDKLDRLKYLLNSWNTFYSSSA
ncbi:IS701 family transposase [Synechocystis sp. PCC 7339]|nr:IS701 family transposase [Synechocystis sp. PCC 7339]UAJ72714.1 IS701 family transposase [Synechocystis sp. PCC 7339]